MQVKKIHTTKVTVREESMYCGNCGNEMKDSAKFCSKCGSRTDAFEVEKQPISQEVPQALTQQAQPQQAQPQQVQSQMYQAPDKQVLQGAQPKSKSKSPIIAVLSIALVLVLVAIGVLYFKGNRQEDIGFKTEQEVMEYFTKQVAKSDFEAATKCFAINHKAEGYDLGKYVEHMNYWAPAMDMNYPAEDRAYLEANKVLLKATAMREIANMCVSLGGNEEFFEGTPIILKDGNYTGADIENMTKDIDPIGLKVISMRDAMGELSSGNDYVKTRGQFYRGAYGAEDFMEYEVRYEWNGKDYAGGATFMKYDGKWYLESLSSTILGTKSSLFAGYLES